jgi:hypothetical protein
MQEKKIDQNKLFRNPNKCRSYKFTNIKNSLDRLDELGQDEKP